MSEEFDKATGEIPQRVSVPGETRIRTSAQLDELFAAMAKAQPKFRSAAKSGKNPHFGSSYAELDDVIEAAKEPLGENGLCVLQPPTDLVGRIAVTTFLGHASGQYVESTLSFPIASANIQTIGSVITYIRRYCWASILGIAPGNDDDGEAAVGRGNGQQQRISDRVTRANPKVAEPSEETNTANSAFRKIADAIDQTHDWIAMRAIYDEGDGKWGRAWQGEIDLIAKASPSSVPLLRERLQRRLNTLAQMAAQPSKRPSGRPRKNEPPPDLAEGKTPEEIAEAAKLMEGKSPADLMRIAEERRVDHRTGLLKLARTAALTAGRDGLRRYCQALRDADRDENTTEWKDIEGDVMDTLLPLADKFDQGTLDPQTKVESDKLLADLTAD